MDFVADVYQLSQDFINDYPNDVYPELMHKLGRPYSCLLIDNHDDYYICIPFRSNINHKNAFLFHGTKRSMKSKSGLDYTKIVLINKDNYIDNKQVVVDQDEYNEVQKNILQIVKETIAYIDGYIKYKKGNTTLHVKEYERRYRFSTLKYFHDIMNI